MTDIGILEAHRPLDEPSDRAAQIIADVTTAFSATVVGQHRLRDTLLIGLLTGGHILLESAPGLAKTTAALTIARSVGGVYTRIQCTPDLLPSDITGTQIFDARVASFTTQLGPVHSNFVLLDEINRSSAKTQSAMLEAMQERQTTIGGQTHRLPDPFLVLATQNPLDREGTHALPEAQLDRFLLKDVVEYPSPAEEFEILSRLDLGLLDSAREVQPVATLDDIRYLQQQSREVFVDESIRRYIITLSHITRNASDFIDRDLARYVEHGASPRASIAFLQSTRALALLSGRRHVIPEDVKQVGHAVLRHRLALGYEAEPDGVTAENVIDAIFGSIATP